MEKPEFVSDHKSEIKKNPRYIYKLTYDEYELCKRLQGRLWSDMTVKELDKVSSCISEIVKVIFPDAVLKQLKSDDPTVMGWEIEYKKGRPFLYIYMNTEDLRPMLIDQMRFDITQPNSILHY